MRKLKIAIGVVAVLAALVVAFYAFELWRGKRAWARYQAEAEQRGTKLWLEDFLPPPVPDAENFASIPIFQRAFAALPNLDNALALPTEFREPLKSKLREQNSIDLAAWQAWFAKAEMLPGEATADSAADVLRALERHEPALAELREAAARPGCRFPVEWEKGLVAPVPHLSVIMSAVTISGIQVQANLAQGNAAAAYGGLHLYMRIVTLLEKEPVLMTGAVRSSIASSLANAVWSGLTREAWNDAMLVKIIDDVGRFDLLASGRFAIASERGAFNVWMRAYHTESASYRTGLFTRHLSTPVAWAYPMGWTYQNQVIINRLFDESLVRLTAEDGRYVLMPDSSSDYEPKTQMEHLYYAPMVLLQAPSRDAERRFASVHSLLQQTRLACALARFRNAGGEFPAQLEMLVPEFAPAIPRDVMDGQPMRYRRTEDGGYVLYSIALNLKDDGAPAMKPNRSTYRQDDWVWRMPGKSNQ